MNATIIEAAGTDYPVKLEPSYDPANVWQQTRDMVLKARGGEVEVYIDDPARGAQPFRLMDGQPITIRGFKGDLWYKCPATVQLNVFAVVSVEKTRP